ncbi:uncharacterized protein METZ01_LOCUS331516 [marine metagenome]|uniref:Porin domain-containing protein n=1 Tax=marine metagenome TaxID=408172 RepID=A0A382Q2K2_9ZZZZ
MKKLIAAMAALLMSATSVASIALSGKYTGTLDDSGVYTQDLTTTLVGASAAGAVTVTLDKDFAVDDMFVESTIAGIKFKLGEVDDVTSIGASTAIGPVTVGINQPSGGAATFDVDGTFAGITVGVDDITNEARETTATYKIAGLTLGVEHAKSGTDHQVQVDVATHVGGTTTIDGTTGGFTLALDRNQNADNDAFEDGSWGGSVSTALGGIGTVTASGHLTDADVKSYGLSVTQGIFTGSWDKTGSADGVLSLKAELSF